jgi:hypothetical protein
MSVNRGVAGDAVVEARSGTQRPRARRLAASLILLLGSVLFSLAVLEVGVRLVRSGPEGLAHWPNLAHALMSNGEDGTAPCSYSYDNTLGWTLPPNCALPRYNTDADGFRRTPPAMPLLAEPPILATGASFTLGEEVADDETWPAYLQNLTGRKVVNAGVSGYSLDQTVLRTERLASQVKPLFIVLSFTPGDIRRSELKVAWSREKPYFTLTDGRLALSNVPVPGQPHAVLPLPLAARLLGRSVLADEVVKRLGIGKGWYFDEVQGMPSGSGPMIACLLMPRLAQLGVPVVVLAQYGRSHWTADAEGKATNLRTIRKVLACATEAGLISADVSESMKPVVEVRGIDALFRRDHHSAEGNRVTADLLMDELVGRQLLPRTAHR